MPRFVLLAVPVVLGGALVAALLEDGPNEPLATVEFRLAPVASRGVEAQAAGLVDSSPRLVPAATPVEGPLAPVRLDSGERGRLLGRRGWVAFQRAASVAVGGEDDRALDPVAGLFARTDDPVLRQNLIFHAALALPVEIARPWLHGLWRTGADGDAADALCALAFAGDSEAMASFVALARSPAPVDVRLRLDDWQAHEALAEGGGGEARARLRSYRAIEVLDGAPYFKMTAVLVRLGWTARAPLAPADQVALLEAWLGLWPGHPGSDDMALRVARLHLAAGDLLASARWHARAAALPDQDVTHGAIEGLLSLAELHLSPWDVLRLALEGREAPQGALLAYVHVRRVAAESGFAAGLDAAARMAATLPGSALEEGWAGRWASPVPEGLESGASPLPPDDPLRRRIPAPTPQSRPGRRAPYRISPGSLGPRQRYPAVEDPMQPSSEALALGTTSFARQARLWETLADLEMRASRARGDARADLLYKQAAVLYHQPDALFPLWAWPSRGLGLTLDAAGLPHADALPARHAQARARFARESFGHLRAIALFERIEREHPRWPWLDRAVFSRGLAWKRFADWGPAAIAEESDGAIGRAVGAFDDVVRTFPESPLARDAAAAAAWWRRARPGLIDGR